MSFVQGFFSRLFSRLENWRENWLLPKIAPIRSDPVGWMRENPKRAVAVVGTILAIVLLPVVLVIGSMWMAQREAIIADNSILMFDIRSKRLRACLTETLPGSDGVVNIMLFTHAAKPVQPAEGMSLEDLERAGLVVGWFFQLDPHTGEGMYAAPGSPDTWVPATAENLQSITAQSLRNPQQKEGAPPVKNDLVPCMTRIRALKGQQKR